MREHQFQILVEKELPVIRVDARAVAPSFASRTNTANGYSLVPERSPLDGTPDCRFRVLEPAGTQRNISVCFDRW
jgi:hypothetical protein